MTASLAWISRGSSSLCLFHTRRLNDRRLPNSPAQVKTISRFLYPLLLFVMLTSTSVVAYPRKEETKDGVSRYYIETSYCQPPSEADLIRRMGPAYDSSRMATNEDGIKRSVSSASSQDQDPVKDAFVDDADLEDYFTQDDKDSDREGEDSAFVDSAASDPTTRHSRDGDLLSLLTTTPRPDYRFMRRKRNAKLDDKLLHLQLLSSGKNKKIRKQLKKKIREKLNSKKFRKNPPWECKMDIYFQETKSDYFPKYVRTGRCVTDKCFYRLYSCVPTKYPIRLMKRDPDRCVPIPTVGVNTTYEERWDFVRHYVIVGCDCKPKRRRRQ